MENKNTLGGLSERKVQKRGKEINVLGPTILPEKEGQGRREVARR